MNKSAVHPITGDICIYNDADHTYTIAQTGQKLISVTQLIQSVTPEFDAKVVAEKCVGKGKYAGMTADFIQKEWEKEGDRGRREGHNLHLYQECLFLGHPTPEPESDRERALFETGKRVADKLMKKFIFVGAEVLLFSAPLGIAGTTDLILYDPTEMELVFIDWKQNKKIKTENYFEWLKPPFGHLQNSDIVKYGLQLNLYKTLYNSMTSSAIHDVNTRKAIIHITEEGFFTYPTKEEYQTEIRILLTGVGR